MNNRRHCSNATVGSQGMYHNIAILIIGIYNSPFRISRLSLGRCHPESAASVVCQLEICNPEYLCASARSQCRAWWRPSAAEPPGAFLEWTHGHGGPPAYSVFSDYCRACCLPPSLYDLTPGTEINIHVTVVSINNSMKPEQQIIDKAILKDDENCFNNTLDQQLGDWKLLTLCVICNTLCLSQEVYHRRYKIFVPILAGRCIRVKDHLFHPLRIFCLQPAADGFSNVGRTTSHFPFVPQVSEALLTPVLPHRQIIIIELAQIIWISYVWARQSDDL